MEFSTVSKFAVLLLVIDLQFTQAQIDLLGGSPLLTGATSFTFAISTTTLTKPTPCFVTSGDVSQCRRKRGLQEKPEVIQFDDSQIAPSAVVGLEATPAPRALRSRFNAERIFSSFDDNYYNSFNVFRQLAAKGRNNIITVGDCGKSTVNFSQFLSCLGLTVQETTTLTATFTETMTLSSGFTTLTVGGCTPVGFPYMRCPAVELSATADFNSTESGSDITTPSPTITPLEMEYTNTTPIGRIPTPVPNKV